MERSTLVGAAGVPACGAHKHKCVDEQVHSLSKRFSEEDAAASLWGNRSLDVAVRLGSLPGVIRPGKVI
jgi:hypothetical protein